MRHKNNWTRIGFDLATKSCLIFLMSCLSFSPPATAQVSPEKESANAAISYLCAVMDEYHTRFPVYDDVSSAGNHFHAHGKMPKEATVTMDGSWTDYPYPHSGATAYRCELPKSCPGGWGGFCLQNGILRNGDTKPSLNWGAEQNAGINLSGAVRLTFWARGQNGGEKIEFFMGGVGRNADWGYKTEEYPDSTPRYPIRNTLTELTNYWKKYPINLQGLDLRYVLGGFAWVANIDKNPDGAVFFLDDIQYELGDERRTQRLNEKRFLRSFTTKDLQPSLLDDNKDDDIDLVLRNTAFTYDNALALLAFLADGSEDSLRRARLIGDAFVYACKHDRDYVENRSSNDGLSYKDGCIRSAYSAGDISLPPGWVANGKAGTVPASGYYAPDKQGNETFYEVEQDTFDVGNNAWVGIALLSLYRCTGQAEYLDTALTIGNFIRTFRDLSDPSDTSGQHKGFLGGWRLPETGTEFERRTYASAEHNIDVRALFNALSSVTGDTSWWDDAKLAEAFVEAMWDSTKQCYLCGTGDNGKRNMTAGQLPLDVQLWSILAIPKTLALHPSLLTVVELNHRYTDAAYAACVANNKKPDNCCVFDGYDFNEDKDGVWFEGTGQAAVAYAIAGDSVKADAIRSVLRNAQQQQPTGNGEGIAAACFDGLTTGFITNLRLDFKYYRRLHVGATAWLVFAQLGYNPYWVGDKDGDGVGDCLDFCKDDPRKVTPGLCGCGELETDTDGDSFPDCIDGCPNDPTKTIEGACGCGKPDTDSDNDGTADCIDGCPSDPAKTAPGVCGCGVADTDTDGDGAADCKEECDNDPLKTGPGVCGCGTPDTDTDGDGTLDCNDRCPSDPAKTAPGVCGCGVADTDTDTDGDGTADCEDGCPNDPAKTAPGNCGCGNLETERCGVITRNPDPPGCFGGAVPMLPVCVVGLWLMSVGGCRRRDRRR